MVFYVHNDWLTWQLIELWLVAFSPPALLQPLNCPCLAFLLFPKRSSYIPRGASLEPGVPPQISGNGRRTDGRRRRPSPALKCVLFRGSEFRERERGAGVARERKKENERKKDGHARREKCAKAFSLTSAKRNESHAEQREKAKIEKPFKISELARCVLIYLLSSQFLLLFTFRLILFCVKEDVCLSSSHCCLVPRPPYLLLLPPSGDFIKSLLPPSTTTTTTTELFFLMMQYYCPAADDDDTGKCIQSRCF